MHSLLRIVVPVVILAMLFSVGSNNIKKQLTNESSSTACVNTTASGDFEINRTAHWLDKEISPPLAKFNDTPNILGAADESKWIEVDLSDQTLRAHQGDSTVFETKISSGKFGRTPPGEFRIWMKLRYTLMQGGVRGTGSYYYLPNVPYTMFFYNDKTPKWKGYGLHGTYWHNNFGQPMSHGCVNLPTDMAEKLFYWTDPQVPSGKNSTQTKDSGEGTRIVIHE